ncbi:mitochondrial matrix iron-sulfur protein [Naganishia albida]|nr:mitochondrial matrix iron-sulfur protein [Naganishia albida]
MFKSALSLFARRSVVPARSAPLARANVAQNVWRATVVRGFSSSPVWRHEHIERPAPGTGIKVTFKDAKGEVIRAIEGNEGDDLLSLAHEYDIDLEGACGGSIACSTCHLIIDPAHYDLLEEPGDDENDMLDLAYGLTDTSRLGCQVRLSKDLDGMEATLPSATRNMYVDGHKPTPH